MKSGQNYINHKFHKKILLFSDVREYLHGFDLVFTWLILFSQYADDTFHVISEFHAQRSKWGGKFDKFGVKSEGSWDVQDSWDLFFPTLHQYNIYS